MPAIDQLQYTETYEGGHKYHYTGKCRVTGKQWTVSVPGQELHQYRRGKHIQVAMPSLSAEDREFLLSGISPEGWDQYFGKEK